MITMTTEVYSVSSEHVKVVGLMGYFTCCCFNCVTVNFFLFHVPLNYSHDECDDVGCSHVGDSVA